MTHDHANGAGAARCPACAKKVINNYVFIANLALLVEGPEAAALWQAADTYSNILKAFGLNPTPPAAFEGCEQGQLLVKWITTDASPDVALIKEWTAAIWSAIDDLAHGKMP